MHWDTKWIRCTSLLRDLSNQECKWTIMGTKGLWDSCLRRGLFHFRKGVRLDWSLENKLSWDKSAKPAWDQDHRKKVLGNLEKTRKAPVPTFWVKVAGRVTGDRNSDGRGQQQRVHIYSILRHSLPSWVEFMKLALQDLKRIYIKFDKPISLNIFYFLFISFWESTTNIYYAF